VSPELINHQIAVFQFYPVGKDRCDSSLFLFFIHVNSVMYSALALIDSIPDCIPDELFHQLPEYWL